MALVIAEPGVVAEAIGTDLARKILSAVRPRSRGVALSLSDDRDEICAMVDAVRPDVLHVVAREIEPEDCAWIRERIAPVMLLRAIAVRAGETLTEADAHQDCVDYLMLDSGAKGRPFAGATGETHDWSASRTVVERSRIPVILAGGLSAENVADAIATVRPWGVDSFTHTDLPGQSRQERSGARASICRGRQARVRANLNREDAMNRKQLALSAALIVLLAMDAYSVYLYGYIGFFRMVLANFAGVTAFVDLLNRAGSHHCLDGRGRSPAQRLRHSLPRDHDRARQYRPAALSDSALS